MRLLILIQISITLRICESKICSSPKYVFFTLKLRDILAIISLNTRFLLFKTTKTDSNMREKMKLKRSNEKYLEKKTKKK